jgi:hypothetical protein
MERWKIIMAKLIEIGATIIRKWETVIDDLYIWRRRCRWRNNAKSLCVGKSLTAEEKKEISEYYNHYGFKVFMEYPEFYKEKLGKCNKYYIPNDFHYCVIDPYFNNWKYADVIDNKCFYDIYFPGVKQPEVIGFRINGIWYTGGEEKNSFFLFGNKRKGNRYGKCIYKGSN